MKRISLQIERDVIEGYAAGISTVQLGIQHGIARGSVSNILNRYGVAMRSASEVNTIYDLNEKYFETIDTETKAYWLGFIGADGCVTTRGAFTMMLAGRDESHLDLFRRTVGYTGPMLRRVGRAGRIYIMLTINRHEFVSNLIRQGIFKRKTWCLTPWNGPPHLMRHYWRGLVDGDGWISRGQNGRKTGLAWEIGLVGTKAIADGFATFVKLHTGINVSTRPNRNVWRSRIGGVEFAQAVARLLYEGQSVSLVRKQAKVDEMLAFQAMRTRLIQVGNIIRHKANIATKNGLKSDTFRARLYRGMTVEQAENSNNLLLKMLTWKGKTLHISEWSRVLGIKRTTISERLRRGDSIEQALRT